VVSINPKIYPLEVIQSAAYAMIDKAYVIIDGDPAEEIFVELRPKNKVQMREVELQFGNELLNYAVYYNQARMNKEVRDAIIQRAFLTSTQAGEPYVSEEKFEKPEDPLGISKPWASKKSKKVKS